MRHFTSREFWERFDALPDEIQRRARRSFELLKANPRHPSLRFKKVGPYFGACRPVDLHLVLEDGIDLEPAVLLRGGKTALHVSASADASGRGFPTMARLVRRRSRFAESPGP